MSNVRVWKNVTGVADINGRFMRFGLKGSADITGILTLRSGHGIRLEIEVKTGQARQRPEQINFERMINSMGGKYFLARSVEEAVHFCETLSK